MIATKIDGGISRAVPILLVAAFSSLGTSWFYQTPVVTKKAEELPKVQAQAAQVPVLKKALKAVTCERGVARQAAGQASAAVFDDSIPLPDLEKAKHGNCPTPPPK